MEAALQVDWSDLEAWDKLNAAQAALEELRMGKLEVLKNATVARWIQVGDRCSKEFFEFHKDRKIKTQISKLLQDGRSLTSEEDINSYVYSFYKQLCTNDP